MQHISASPNLAAATLPEPIRDVGLVIDNQDADAHECAFACEARPSRGSQTGLLAYTIEYHPPVVP
jgi:hypothetical protein